MSELPEFTDLECAEQKLKVCMMMAEEHKKEIQQLQALVREKDAALITIGHMSASDGGTWGMVGYVCAKALDLTPATLPKRFSEAEAQSLVDALGWVLPMAKDYAAEHNVGRNQEIVNKSQEVLAAFTKTTEKL